MEDKFDKILSNKIKEVTQKSDIPYNPEHWERLMVKKKKNKKRILVYWQVAAFLLITLLAGGLGNYFFNTSDSENNFNPQIILDKKNDSLRIDSLKNNNQIFITTSDIESLNNTNSKFTKIDSTVIKNKIKSNSKKYFKTEDAIVSNEITTNIQVDDNKDVTVFENKISSSLNDSLKENITVAIKDLKNEHIAQVIKKEKSKDATTNTIDISIIEQKLEKDSLNGKKDIALLEEKDDALDTKISKSIKLGIDVSPLYSYNQQSESSTVGFAGGLIIEIPITNKFDIYTGVFYADQKIDLNKTTSYLSDVVSSKKSSQLINKEAVKVGIEIPVNVKYNFSIAEKEVFVSAGFTSTSYIKDNIEEKFLVNNRTQASGQDSNGNNIVRYELVQINSKVVTPNNSNDFNFANILNFSLGIEFPLNKQQQSVVIEPYFKYSLAPITEQKIDFSSAGIHLRYNFSLKNKN